jgi:PAS domain S-box-containing protein
MTEPLEQHQTDIILNSIADGVFTVDLTWRITSFNRAAERITGIPRAEAVGRYCWEVFKASICEASCSLRQTLQTGDNQVQDALFIVNAQGDRVPVSISTALLEDADGRVIGGVETFRDLSVIEALRKELSEKCSFQDIISKNREMHRLFGMVELVADHDATVLIEGESGTGKELFARAIHTLSHRSGSPLVTVNCGAIPDTLLESELFGYRAGAFTDARRDKPGRLARAAGGTLFLDEIGDVSPMLQVRLLRLLQEKTYEPLGSQGPETADVRIVAATNRNLADMVRDGRFRQDLYYRLNVVRLPLPPLRARKEDIPALSEHFIRRFNRLNRREIPGLAPDALPMLMAHDYPGNIRELENIIEFACIVCRGATVGASHLPEYLRNPESVEEPLSGVTSPSANTMLFREAEAQRILSALRRNQGHRARTARQLGIHPSTLWRKIKALGLTPPDADGRSCR